MSLPIFAEVVLSLLLLLLLQMIIMLLLFLLFLLMWLILDFCADNTVDVITKLVMLPFISFFSFTCEILDSICICC